MLDNDDIMTAKASEVIQKVSTDNYHKCVLCSHSIFSRKGWVLITHIQRS